MAFDTDGWLELIGKIFSLIGAGFMWLVCLGRKPFNELLKMEAFSGIVGFLLIVVNIILFKNYILKFILQLIQNKLENA